jgi:hypothetical protein
MSNNYRKSIWVPLAVVSVFAATASGAFAGDFSNPVPFSGDDYQSKSEASERNRLAAAAGASSTLLNMGDYYERSQQSKNYNNSIGFDVSVKGDNNVLNLSINNSKIKMTSDGTCQITKNDAVINDPGTGEVTTVQCGEVE